MSEQLTNNSNVERMPNLGTQSCVSLLQPLRQHSLVLLTGYPIMTRASGYVNLDNAKFRHISNSQSFWTPFTIIMVSDNRTLHHNNRSKEGFVLN